MLAELLAEVMLLPWTLSQAEEEDLRRTVELARETGNLRDLSDLLDYLLATHGGR